MVCKKTYFIPLVLVLLIASLPLIAPASAQDDGRVSAFGEYRGYSEPIYREWRRQSQYVAVRDGTQLAVDIIRPAVDGVPVDDPLPVIWTHHRYHRADVSASGGVFSIMDEFPDLARIVAYGYVIAVVDVRGGGASFGMRRGEFSPEETRDAYDMTEWFAAQPWCDGNVGMFGLSYLAITQYLAASTHPPHLKALFPMMAMFDMYQFAYPGGVFMENFVLSWGTGTIFLDKLQPAAPVDVDTDGAMLKAAIAEHAENWNIFPILEQSPYRDSLGPEDIPIFATFNPSPFLDQINASGVAIYSLGGWFDMYPRDTLQWFNNLTVPQKVVLTPWSHNGTGGFDLVAEHLRWFDYWLKGIDNGIMDEPPLVYNVMGAPRGTEWRTTDQWPLPNEVPTAYYFDAGPSGSVKSVNDGLLTTAAPPPVAAQDDYVVDYTTTTGQTTRWTDGYGGGYDYPDMVTNDQKGLTYTTPPLETDTEITGHPVAHLWVTATTPDADFIVYLEEVDPDGTSTYLTEGTLRASYRATTDAPWNNMGLPFHRGNEADVAPLPPGEPVELVFDMQPTSNVFDAGHRIRITITGADADTYAALVFDPPPTVSLYRGGDHASHVVLPVIPAE